MLIQASLGLLGIHKSHALPKSRDLLSFESENANMAIDKFPLTVD